MATGRFKKLVFGTGLNGTDNADDSITVDVTGAPPTGSAGGSLDGSYPNPGIASSVAGNGLSESSNVLAVNVDGSTLEINTDALRVKDAGVTEAKLGFTDITTNNASTSQHGLLPKLPGGSTTFLRADGSFAAPGTAGSVVSADAIWDAKGDLAAATGADAAVRVAVGANGTILTAASGESAGVKWVTPDGWTDDSAATWTYVSASTFSVTGDRTAVFTAGTRLRFTQTTVKYAVVVSSAFSSVTTVTIAVNTDYTIANAAITVNSYSYENNPQGYPGWFAYASGAVGGGWGSTTTNNTRFSVSGRTCFISFNIAGTSNATSITLNVPLPAAGQAMVGNYPYAVNNGVLLTTDGMWAFASVGDTTVAIRRDPAANAWTATGTKQVIGYIVYEV